MSSGSSRSSSSRDSGLDPAGMGGDEVGGLTDGQDPCRLLIGNPDAVAVLQLDHELDEIERVRLQVLPEPRGLVDAARIHLELGGQVLPDAVENLLAGHRWATLAAPADRKAPAASSAAVVRPTMSSSTARPASFTACSMPVGPKLPCATTTGFRSPSRIAPPTFSGSRSSRSPASLPRTRRPPTLEATPERMRERISPDTTFTVPSSTLSATLPVNPSATTTSARAPGMSKPSRFPTKLSAPASAMRSCAVKTPGVFLTDSATTESSPTDGRSMPTTASMNPAPM